MEVFLGLCRAIFCESGSDSRHTHVWARRCVFRSVGTYVQQKHAALLHPPPIVLETPDGSEYDAATNFSANATLAISTTVCSAGAALSEERLHTYISKLTDSFMISMLCFNVISGGSDASSCLTCPEFLIVPNGGNVAKYMIADTEVCDTLTFVIKKTYGGMRAMLVTRQALLRLCSSTTKRWTSRILLSWIRMSSHVANEESSHERGVPFCSSRFLRVINPTLC